MNKLLVVLISLIFLFSCSDSTSPEPVDINDYKHIRDFMPLTEATWWMYETYEIDADGNLSDDFSIERQTIIEVYNAGDTTVCVIDSEDNETGEYLSTNNYKFYNNKVYTSQFMNFELPIIQSQLLLIDYDENEWTVIDDPALQFEIFGNTVSGKITGEAQKSYQDEIIVKNKKIQCQTIDYEISFTGSFVFNNNIINVVADMEAKIWLGLKTGIVKMEIEPTLLNAGLFTQTIPGSQMNLIDYKIN